MIDGKSRIIGRILARAVGRAAADEEIANIVEESRAKQLKVSNTACCDGGQSPRNRLRHLPDPAKATPCTCDSTCAGRRMALLGRSCRSANTVW